MNKVCIIGNLTRDAEVRYTQGGMAIANIGIAVNDRVKNQRTEEWEDYPNFVNCTMFGKRAEALKQYLNKGQKVGIDGHLHWSQWDTDAGKRSKLEVIVDNLDLLGGGKKKEAEPAEEQAEIAFNENVPF